MARYYAGFQICKSNLCFESCLFIRQSVLRAFAVKHKTTALSLLCRRFCIVTKLTKVTMAYQNKRFKPNH